MSRYLSFDSHRFLMPFHPVKNAMLLLAILISAEGFCQDDPDPLLPVHELDDLEVNYSASNFAPDFHVEVPQLSYYDCPDLPNAYLILALEFMDRYRASSVPGKRKWAAFLIFPVIDGFGNMLTKWLCLYCYDGQLYGYDPMGNFENEKRFFIPIRYEDRKNPDLLYRFASSYVENVYPQREMRISYAEMVDPSDSSAGTRMVQGYIVIPKGRIASQVPSKRTVPPKELVSLLNEYTEDPNLSQDAPPLLGPPLDYGKWDISLKGLWGKMLEMPDYLEVGRKLVHPRWGRVANLYYQQKFLFFGEREGRKRVLLFNIGYNIYSYHPAHGVWVNPAEMSDLNNLETVVEKLQFPGVETITRIEFVQPETSREEGIEAGPAK